MHWFKCSRVEVFAASFGFVQTGLYWAWLHRDTWEHSSELTKGVVLE